MSLLLKQLSAKTSSQAIISDINLNLAKGHHLSIMGHSGSGKSTLIRSILGLETHLRISGTINFDGHTIEDPLRSMPRKGFAYVPQNLSLWPHLNVLETLELTRSFAQSDLNTCEILSIFGLLSLKNRFPKGLSQGEQQRLAQARAIIAKPSLLILDEPFSSLDTVSRHSMLKLLKSIQKDFTLTTIFITHDLAEAFFLGGELMILHQGRSIWSGPSSKFTIDLPQWPLLESHRSFYHPTRSASDVRLL